MLSVRARRAEEHVRYLRDALAQAHKCTPSPTAFCVGCVLVVRGVVLATGHSRELPGNTHAEANALANARALSPAALAALFPAAAPPASADDLLRAADVYTTLEPCSVRTSGLAPCADALVAARVRRCFVGVGEPDDFVKCEGAQRLMDAGIEVVWVKGLEDECLAAARRGHDSPSA